MGGVVDLDSVWFVGELEKVQEVTEPLAPLIHSIGITVLIPGVEAWLFPQNGENGSVIRPPSHTVLLQNYDVSPEKIMGVIVTILTHWALGKKIFLQKEPADEGESDPWQETLVETETASLV